MIFNGVLFDLDGTLLNTIGDINNALNKTLGSSFTTEQCKKFVGNGLKNALKAALVSLGRSITEENEINALYYQFEENYALSPTNHTFVYPGVEDVLLKLKEHAIPFGVFSNKVQPLAERVISALFPTLDFAFICGMGGLYPAKPNPSAILGFCRKIGVNTEKICYVGDSEVDFKTGMNAMVKTLIVTWGFRSKTELAELGVDSSVLIESPQLLWTKLGGQN